jgi:lipopolysaccharide/colanic/teichoic acid biosynthesis glycosyltransferase
VETGLDLTAMNRFKRIFDLFCSAILITLLFPIGLGVGVAIFVLDGWPIFFVQPRVGKDLKIFNLFKFRTMQNGSERGGFQTSESDPRVTQLGRILRTTSIDELPQLANILLGQMSLVGPRPDVPLAPQFVPYTDKTWRERHLVRPGLTGLAQVSGRSNLTFEERLRFDLEYVQHHGMITDFVILLKTVQRVIRKTGTT